MYYREYFITEYIYRDPSLCQIVGLTFCRFFIRNAMYDRNGCRRQLYSTWQVTGLDQIIEFTLISSCEVFDNIEEVCWFNAGFCDLQLKRIQQSVHSLFEQNRITTENIDWNENNKKCNKYVMMFLWRFDFLPAREFSLQCTPLKRQPLVLENR